MSSDSPSAAQAAAVTGNSTYGSTTQPCTGFKFIVLCLQEREPLECPGYVRTKSPHCVGYRAADSVTHSTAASSSARIAAN